MRKSLLMTSALGLTALVMPTLAMAGAAVGSSPAACGSGFFAQFDAKIMSAKLEIKNEKKNTPVEADASVSEDAVRQELVNSDLKKFAELGWKVRFNYGTGATRNEFLVAVLSNITIGSIAGKTDSNIAVAISGVVQPLNPIANPANPTDSELAALLKVGGRVFTDALNNDADAAADFRKLAKDLRELANDARKYGEADATTLNDAMNHMANNNILSRVVVRNTQTIDDAVGVAFLANVLHLVWPDLIKAPVVLVIGNRVDVAAINDENAQQSIAKYLSDSVYRNSVLAAIKTDGDYAGRVAQQIENNIALNTRLAKMRAFPDLTDRRVYNQALAGGVGATVGWWQNLGGFALSISGSGDYHWGTFRMMDDAAGSPMKAEDKRKLGFGVQGNLGLHYVVSPSTTLGVLVGLRGQQLNFGRSTTNANANTTSSTNSTGDYVAKWMINPVVSAQARTFFTDNVYGALTVGYIIPMSEKDYALDNTNIDKDAKIRFQGLTGGFSIGMTF